MTPGIMLDLAPEMANGITANSGPAYSRPCGMGVWLARHQSRPSLVGFGFAGFG